MSSLSEYRRLNTRTASVVQVGGFRPTLDPFASHFRLRPLAAPGESWPAIDGHPLSIVCQLNLTAAPVLPPLLQDLALITFFADLETGAKSHENGADWCLRAYASLDGLAPLDPPAGAPKGKRGLECLWENAADHPCFEDPERVTLDGFDDSEVELENIARTKLGGYPSLIQAEAWWSLEEHPADPRYCLQINSEEKAGLAWGDAGTLYLARGTAPGCAGKWFLDWQCL